MIYKAAAGSIWLDAAPTMPLPCGLSRYFSGASLLCSFLAAATLAWLLKPAENRCAF